MRKFNIKLLLDEGFDEGGGLKGMVRIDDDDAIPLWGGKNPLEVDPPAKSRAVTDLDHRVECPPMSAMDRLRHLEISGEVKPGRPSDQEDRTTD